MSVSLSFGATKSGYVTAVQEVAFRVKLDGNVISSGSFGVNVANAHSQFPPLQVVIASATVAQHTLVFEVNPGANSFVWDQNDIVTYALR